MKTAKIVVGAGYGDEGKGLMTDYFCSKGDPLRTVVVRYNGGAQAGHTVVLGEERHVFSHFGSGTLRGCDTYLDDDFIVNPVFFRREAEKLDLSAATIIVSPNCRVTTPYDMLLNLILERHNNRKASCGAGIFTTLRRDVEVPIRVGELYAEDLEETLLQVKAKVVATLEELGIVLTSAEKTLLDLDYTTAFKKDVEYFLYMTMRPKLHSSIVARLNFYNTFVFEGAQGLLLSERHGVMPYCTPSDPGALRPAVFCKDLGITNVEVCYVSRIYATRHGDGPLDEEADPYQLGIKADVEKTNVYNEHQGEFRYGPLQVDLLETAINDDFVRALYGSAIPLKQTIAITCLDQVMGKVKDVVMDSIINVIGTPTYLSYGPTAKDVVSLLESPKQ